MIFIYSSSLANGKPVKTIAPTRIPIPYNGDTLVEIQQANKDQLNEAYNAATKAQEAWAKKTPVERAAVLYKVVSILDQRQEEIVDWLIKESGSTRIKAMVELSTARAITLKRP